MKNFLRSGSDRVGILYICSFYHRAMIFKDCMDALIARGNDVKVFNATWKGDVVAKKYYSIMTESVIHKECYYKWERYIFFTKHYKIYKQMIRSYNILDFDILHAHNLFNGGIAAYFGNKKTGIPFIISVRASDISVFMNFAFFRELALKIVKEASGIQFISVKHKEKFLNDYVRQKDRASIEDKCFVSFNGLEEYWLENINKPKTLEKIRSIKLLFVGKINKNKNILTTVEACKVLIDRGYNVYLTVVGKILDRTIANQLNDVSFVTTIDFKPKEELINIYRENDIFVMPSKNETLGRVYAEAMTQGLPVIYSKDQGFDGIFIDGEVGYAVPSNNPEFIADCVEKIIKNYQKMSNACIKESTRFDWKKISKEIECFYEKIMKKEMEKEKSI